MAHPPIIGPPQPLTVLPSAPLPEAYFAALTGMRAVAAFMVFFFHFNPFQQPGRPATGFAKLVGAFIDQGHAGVTIFFVLSGFLIAIRYLDRVEPTLTWFKSYALNRFARIYPLYFLLTALTFMAMAGHLWAWYTWNPTGPVRDKIFSMVANLTLTRALFHDFLLQGVPTAWTLTVEMCFYLAAPGLLLALRKRPFLLPFFALALLATGALLTLVATQLQVYGRFMQPLSFTLHQTFFGRGTEFLAGIGLALWVRKRPPQPARRGATALGLGLGLMATCLAGMATASWHYLPSAEWPAPLAATLINNFLLPVGIVVLFNGLMHERTWLQQLLTTRLLMLLGKSSYAFYLIHVGLFSDLLGRLIGRHVFTYFVVFNVLAILLYHFVERPAQLSIQQWFRRATKPCPATAFAQP